MKIEKISTYSYLKPDHTGKGTLKWGPTLRSNGKCSNENAIMDNDLMKYDLFGIYREREPLNDWGKRVFPRIPRF